MGRENGSKLACVRSAEVNLQVYSAKKGSSQTALSHVRRCSNPGAFDEHSSGAMRREVEGSENLVFHDSTSFIVWNLMRAKRCVLLREIHDLETRE